MRDFIAFIMATLTLCVGHGPVLARTHPGDVPPVASIRMVDASNGWVVTNQSGSETLLRTSDAGMHWRDVSPLKSSRGQLVDYQVTARGALVAWVASSGTATGGPGGITRIFRTVDGGRTWRSTAIPAVSVVSIHFINTRDGWVLSNEVAAAGSMEVDIYRSTDGGATWTKVERTRVDDQRSGLPFAGDKTGITFLTTTRGWVTGAIAADDWMYLYVTNDGGRTWRQQRLPVPPRVTPHWNDWTMPPTFFTPRAGVLPVFYSIRNNAHREIAAVMVFYVTQDGGMIWTDTTPVPLTLGSGFSTSFADFARGWVTDGAALYATGDGGRRWKMIRPNRPFAHVTHLDFVSPRFGWAVRQTSPYLLKTVDGGHTWVPVTYAISRR